MIQCSSNSGLLLHVRKDGRNRTLAVVALGNLPMAVCIRNTAVAHPRCLTLTKTAFAAKQDNTVNR